MKKMCSILIALAMVLIIPAGAFADSNYSAKYYNYPSIEDMAYDDFEIGKSNGDNLDAIIVVNSNSLDSDGLSASSLVSVTNGQICAISNNDSGAKLSEMAKYSGSGDIYFIGGPQVIPESFKNKFKAQGYNCITLAGKNRIETSYKVANEVRKIKGNIKEIAITSAYKGVPDSVSIAYTAFVREMPVILTNGKSIPFSTNGVKTYAIGGNAVISNSLVNKTGAIRLGGKNRYETNKKIIEYFKHNKYKYTLCYGDSSGVNMKIASLCGCLNYGYPVILVSDNCNKDILSGATIVEFMTVNKSVPDRLKVACFNARYGPKVTAAADLLYKASGLNRDKYAFGYVADRNCNAGKRPNYEMYASKYYIFKLISFKDGTSNFDILIDKNTNVIYEWGPKDTKPIISTTQLR